MLYLLFELEGDRYALAVAQIAEVLALAPAKSIPGAPAWIAGVIERHGVPVPVIDVPRLALGRPARALCSTRLVLVRYGAAGRDEAPLLGLIVERATYTRRIDDAQFADSGVATPHARWLGPVASLPDGLVQRVDVPAMLDDGARALLFPATPLPA
ncbi:MULTISPECIES: chemotaxis protein CheW [Ralstonia solanacearum species complex]|uniref:chemotaxis protein CheW n=1 Tax=Ralstonia solanacearum species complex TaxID=3116862 RepID=UPI000E591D70|nr:chemotaxis protein CheW [Ralstonia solanacearum]BEU75173.1 chemotaxis protein CheW [Ralstonia pseudosolanacearum]AXV79932.1 chemotaxis protein CheW [Ralstonia solanacearum]AXV93966.1 chemotaxis protein CheW [Ralstonia solanacearum]AXW21948.1 chemotaxis protein CheW [Ralstonia solanacearum]AXW78860.1 chemotaxis protein CheW [Ralstonia solanacearum]